MTNPDSKALAENAVQRYQGGDFENAARLFGEAASVFQMLGSTLDAAEMKNNQSVALLQAGNASGSYEAALGTAGIFSAAGDFRREGMAFGNEATALVSLGRLDDAVQSYKAAAAALEKAGEDQLRASVMQALAGIHLRRGKIMESMLALKIGLTGLKKPTLKQKIMQGLLRFLA
jgi:tetratricopeptide (TPR) repeat protein